MTLRNFAYRAALLLFSLAVMAVVTFFVLFQVMERYLDTAESEYARMLEGDDSPTPGPAARKSANLLSRLADLETQMAAALPATDSAGNPHLTEMAAALSTLGPVFNNAWLRGWLTTQREQDLAVEYAPLLARLHLPAANHDAFLQLLYNKELGRLNAGIHVSQIMEKTGKLTAAQREQFGRDLAHADQAANDKIRAFLNNPADYAAYLKFVAQKPQRDQVAALSDALATANVPLSADQSAALVQLFFVQRPTPGYNVSVNNLDPNGAAGLGPQQLAGLVEAKRRQSQVQRRQDLIQGAALILSPGQMHVFDALYPATP